jgi:hypothetical protein
MKDTGKMIYKMVLELNLGVMGANLKVVIKKEWSMVVDYISGMMDQCMMVNGLKTKLAEKVFMCGQMVADTKVNGKTIICMEKEYTLGKMAESMKENI